LLNEEYLMQQHFVTGNYLRIMKITVFGAASGIGQHVVKHALNKGYQVTAVISEHHKPPSAHPKLLVLKGAVTQSGFAEKAIKGSDAVINATGVGRDIKAKNMKALTGTKNIITAMETLGVKRYITWSAPQVPFTTDKGLISILGGVMRGLMRIMYKEGHEQMLGIVKAVKESQLDWTIVRIVKLTDGPLTNRVAVMYNGDKMTFRISKEDAAAFMVDQVDSRRYSHAMPIAGTLK
jgi:putative NADH-flavin reductase